MDLVRQILLAIESNGDRKSVPSRCIEFERHDQDQIDCHIGLLEDAGLIKSTPVHTFGGKQWLIAPAVHGEGAEAVPAHGLGHAARAAMLTQLARVPGDARAAADHASVLGGSSDQPQQPTIFPPGGATRDLLPPIPRRAIAAAALCACLFPAPCWSGEGLAAGESRLASTEATCRDFEMTLAKLTPLSPDEVRKLRLLFNSDSPAEQRLELDSLLQKVGTLSPQAVAQLRLALLSPDASVRWMSIQILARNSDAPLLLFARLLRDESRDVQGAAEQALVAAGHPAISPLAQVVAEEPCYSRAKTAATRALGTLGDRCGIEAVAEALIKNQSGCYDHETAFKALRQMGLPAVETLVVLLRYRLLKGGAYLALLEHGPAALKSTLLPLIADPDRAIDDRLHFAEQAEILLGTMAIFRELDAFYLGVAGDKSLPPEIVETARRAWIDRPPRPFVVEALSRERVESDYAARHFIEEDEALAETARLQRRTEMISAARRAKAEADRMSTSSTSAGSTSAGSSPDGSGPVRSSPARSSPARSSSFRGAG